MIISCEPNIWETDQLMRMELGRFKEYTGGPEADRIDIQKPETLKLLENTPTLLLYENNTAGPNGDVVRYGLVHKIHVNTQFIFFRFQEEGRVPREVIKEFATRLGFGSYEFNRTHWAIKEGGILRSVKEKVIATYDVVFSFAGEDRSYVEKVAECLVSRGLKVFYDKFEESQLWGRDLTEHFHQIYGVSGRYCVIFISASYAKKMWTRLERRTALDRAMNENGDYILPARFDDTPIEGIRSSVAYVHLEDLAPESFARLIERKLGRD